MSSKNRKYGTCVCFVCCARFKKVPGYSRGSDERPEDRLLVLEILSTHLGVPVEPIHSVTEEFQRTDSFYCRKCGKWFQQILKASKINATDMGKTILRLQKSLLLRLKKYESATRNLREGVHGIKTMLAKTSQQQRVISKTLPANKVTSNEEPDLTDVSLGVWKLRQLFLNGETEQDPNKPIHANTNCSTQSLNSLVAGFPKNFLISTETQSPINTKKDEASQTDNLTTTDLPSQDDNISRPTTTNNHLQKCLSQVKEEPSDQESSSSEDDNNYFEDPIPQSPDDDEDFSDTNHQDPVSLLNSFRCKLPNQFPPVNTEIKVEEGTVYPEHLSEQESQQNPLRPKRITTRNPKNPGITLSSDSDSNPSDNDSDFNIQDELPQPNKKQPKTKLSHRRIEKLKEFDFHMGPLAPTSADSPEILTWKGVNILAKPSGTLECSLCNESFTPRPTTLCVSIQIRTHIYKTHLNGIPCSICESQGKTHSISTYRGLLLHYERHKNKTNVALCPICSKPFRNPQDKFYRYHIWTHKSLQEQQDEISAGTVPPVPPRQYHCDALSKFLCSHCGKTLHSKYALEKHTQIHLPKAQRDQTKIPCPQCNKMYFPYSLNHHIRESHRKILPVKRYECSFPNCRRIFPRQSQLIDHTQRHTKDFRFHCPTCQKGFSSKTELKVHSVSHSDLRTFNCQVCSKTFKYLKNLTRHTAQVHKDSQDSFTALTLLT